MSQAEGRVSIWSGTSFRRIEKMLSSDERLAISRKLLELVRESVAVFLD